MTSCRQALRVVVGLLLLICLATTAAVSSTVKLTLALWAEAGWEPAWVKVIESFEAANPNIDVEPLFIANAEYEDKVRTMIVSGISPDVFRFDQQRFAGFAHQGAFLDLSQYIKRDWQALDLDDIVPGLLEMWKYNGRYLGMPFDFNPVLISYNTAALAQAGLTPPKRGWTWDDLVRYGQKLVMEDGTGKVTRWGFTTPWACLQIEAWSRSGGSYLISEVDGTSGLLTPKTMDAIQFMQDMFYTYKIAPPLNVPQPDVTFAAGKIAMQLDGHWNVPNLLANKDLSWAMAHFPHRAGEPEKTVYGGGVYTVGAQTKYPEEAWKLAAFVSSKEAQEIIIQMGISMPVRRSLIQTAIVTTTQYDQRIFIDAMQYAVRFPVPPSFRKAQAALQSAMQPIRTGQRGAKEYLPSIANVFEEALKY